MCAKKSLLDKSLTNCTTDADSCAIVVVQRYIGTIFVVQNILWCSTVVVYRVYLAKSGVYLTIPFKKFGVHLAHSH